MVSFLGTFGGDPQAFNRGVRSQLDLRKLREEQERHESLMNALNKAGAPPSITGGLGKGIQQFQDNPGYTPSAPTQKPPYGDGSLPDSNPASDPASMYPNAVGQGGQGGLGLMGGTRTRQNIHNRPPSPESKDTAQSSNKHPLFNRERQQPPSPPDSTGGAPSETSSTQAPSPTTPPVVPSAPPASVALGTEGQTSARPPHAPSGGQIPTTQAADPSIPQSVFSAEQELRSQGGVFNSAKMERITQSYDQNAERYEYYNELSNYYNRMADAYNRHGDGGNAQSFFRLAEQAYGEAEKSVGIAEGIKSNLLNQSIAQSNIRFAQGDPGAMQRVWSGEIGQEVVIQSNPSGGVDVYFDGRAVHRGLDPNQVSHMFRMASDPSYQQAVEESSSAKAMAKFKSELEVNEILAKAYGDAKVVLAGKDADAVKVNPLPDGSGIVILGYKGVWYLFDPHTPTPGIDGVGGKTYSLSVIDPLSGGAGGQNFLESVVPALKGK